MDNTAQTDRMHDVAEHMAEAIRGVDRTSPDLGHMIIAAAFERWPELTAEEFGKANEILMAMEARAAGLNRAQRRALGIRGRP